MDDLARGRGADIPAEGDMKQGVRTGKAKLANRMGGDSALPQAMGSNENDIVQAYRQAFPNCVVSTEHRPVVPSGLEDERRHQDFMERAARKAA